MAKGMNATRKLSWLIWRITQASIRWFSHPLRQRSMWTTTRGVRCLEGYLRSCSSEKIGSRL